MSDLDTVRLLVGDTDSSDELLEDADIQTFLASRSQLDGSGGTILVNLPAAAADCAGAIAAKYARDFDFSEDGQNFQRAQRVGHFLSLEQELRNRSGGYGVSIAGTIST